MNKKKNFKKNLDLIFIILREEILGHKDIDQILPFIYFLSKSENFKFSARCIILENKADYSNNIDPRVQLLFNLKNVDTEFLYKNNFLSKLKKLSESKSSSIIEKFFKKLIRFLYMKQLKLKLRKADFNNKVGEVFKKSKSPIIITAHTNNEARQVVAKIKKINSKAKWMVLPDGTTVVDNKMNIVTHLDKDEKWNKTYDAFRYKNVDYFLQTSKRDLKDAIENGLDSKKGFIIGSPRYNKDWLKIKSQLKLDGKDVINTKSFKVKILFLIPKRHINIFSEELVRTIDFISRYKEIDLILSSADFNYPNLPKHIVNRENIRRCLISKDYSTSKLIDWADIVIHAGTGVVFESFNKGKITVLPRYLSCNTLISDQYNAGFNLRNRDDLRKLCNDATRSIDSLKRKYKKNCQVSNKKFIDDFVNANSNSVKKNIEKKLLEIYKNL